MKRTATGLACLLCALFAGCHGPTDRGACTLVGCHSGMEIVLEDPPEGAYRIEAFAGPEDPRHVFECASASACRVFFAEFTPTRVFIDVVTETGTERFEIVPVYQELRPNGPRCSPVCRQAVVRLTLTG